MTDRSPDDREIFLWRTRRDPTENVNQLATVVATRAICELFNVRGILNQLKDGRLDPVDRDAMRGIVGKHIRTFALINRGSADEPKFEIEFFPLQFAPIGSEGAMYGPDERVLSDLIEALTPMVARTAGPRTSLRPQQLQEIRMRLKQGEPAARIAQSYNVEAETIRQISLDG
jgi:hypothetical protein